MADQREVEGGEATIAAPASGTERTVAAGSIGATQLASGGPLGVGSRLDLGPPATTSASGAAITRPVGEELRAASIERFGVVGRDRFELIDELARGGLGRVLRARDPRTGRIVAVKEVLRPSGDAIARFAREAMVTANLQHPGIVPVYEVGRWDSGEPFYAMKLVRGRAFDALIGEATTTAARIALLPHVIAVADALAYAHSERVIHRDLKPANILVGPYGETLVIDWGLARNLVGDAPDDPAALPLASTLPPDGADTLLGAVVGTPAYMSPEQARGEALDEHADVYAIGAILYHLLGGVRPFAEARTIEDLIAAVATVAPRPLAELAPDVPAELVAIVSRAMAPASVDRYPTAEGLAADLRRFQAGQLVGAHRYTAGQLLRRWVAHHRGVIATVAVAVVAVAVVGGVGVARIATERDEANRQGEVARRERGAAVEARALAEGRFADIVEELGRQALLVGAADRALPLFVGAQAARSETPATLGALGAAAASAYAGLVGLAPALPHGTHAAALSADGTRLYSAGPDDGVRAWDVGAGRAAWTATGAALVALSPDGATLLGVAVGGEVTVRAAATGVEARRWPSPAGEAGSALAWAPSGGGFAIGTVAGHVMLGDPATATLVPCDGHAGEVYDVRFSPSGHQLASIGKDGVLIIRDGATGATVARLRDGAGVASSLAWLGDDRVITGDDRGVVRIWRLADRLVERRLAHPGAIYGVVVGGGARPYVATFGDGTTVLVWDVATGEVRARLPGHRLATDIVVTVGSLLVTTDEPGDVFVWDPDSGERLAALPPEGGLAAVVVGGTRIALVGDGRQRVWEVARDAGRRHLDGHRARIRDLAFTADGQRLLSASNDGSARVVDLATGEARALGEAGFAEPALPTLEAAAAQRPNPHGLRSLALAPDQATVVTASEDGAVTAWDVVTGARRAAWPGHVGRVRRVVFAADGRVAFSVGDTTLRRWDVAAGRELARRDLGEAPWDLALVGQDVVATQTDGGTIALWRAADLTPIATAPLRTKLHELTVVGDEVLDAGRLDVAVIDRAGTTRRRGTVSDAFTAAVSASSSGSRLLAVGTTVHQLVLLDWATLTPVRTWANDDLVVALRFRPDGRLLASASGRKLRVWDPATGNLLIESPELPGLLTQLAWSPDGTRLAAAGGAGTIWVWELGGRTPAALAAIAACASPWRLVDGALVGVPFDAAACAVPAR